MLGAEPIVVRRTLGAGGPARAGSQEHQKIHAASPCTMPSRTTGDCLHCGLAADGFWPSDDILCTVATSNSTVVDTRPETCTDSVQPQTLLLFCSEQESHMTSSEMKYTHAPRSVTRAHIDFRTQKTGQ